MLFRSPSIPPIIPSKMPAAIEYDAPDKSAIEWETTPPPMPTPRPTQPTQKVKKANAVWLAADELLMAQLLLEDKRWVPVVKGCKYT